MRNALEVCIDFAKTDPYLNGCVNECIYCDGMDLEGHNQDCVWVDATFLWDASVKPITVEEYEHSKA